MGRKVGMVHGGCSNARLFGELITEVIPDVEAVHLVDEGLPLMVGEQLRWRVVRRLKAMTSFAEESGAEIVLITCTAFGRLVDEVGEAVRVPVLSVLEIMIDEVMGMTDHIGILGTHPGTLASAAQIINEQSAKLGSKIEVKTHFCPGAFDALRHNDMATHDRIVLEHLDQLMDETAVIIMPQPSIERVIKQVPETRRRVPVLSSVHLSVRRLKEELDSIA
jgi:glutamate racemase